MKRTFFESVTYAGAAKFIVGGVWDVGAGAMFVQVTMPLGFIPDLYLICDALAKTDSEAVIIVSEKNAEILKELFAGNSRVVVTEDIRTVCGPTWAPVTIVSHQNYANRIDRDVDYDMIPDIVLLEDSELSHAQSCHKEIIDHLIAGSNNKRICPAIILPAIGRGEAGAAFRSPDAERLVNEAFSDRSVVNAILELNDHSAYLAKEQFLREYTNEFRNAE